MNGLFEQFDAKKGVEWATDFNNSFELLLPVLEIKYFKELILKRIDPTQIYLQLKSSSHEECRKAILFMEEYFAAWDKTVINSAILLGDEILKNSKLSLGYLSLNKETLQEEKKGIWTSVYNCFFSKNNKLLNFESSPSSSQNLVSFLEVLIDKFENKNYKANDNYRLKLEKHCWL